MSEAAILRRIRKLAANGSPAVVQGIGDDCAVIRPEPAKDLVFTTDFLIEDRHFRFFSPLRGLGHATVARLCQIDYDREMALIAFPVDDADTAWGVARIHADPDNERAEFAGTVSTRDMVAGRTYTLEGLVVGYDKLRQVIPIRAVP